MYVKVSTQGLRVAINPLANALRARRLGVNCPPLVFHSILMLIFALMFPLVVVDNPYMLTTP